MRKLHVLIQLGIFDRHSMASFRSRNAQRPRWLRRPYDLFSPFRLHGGLLPKPAKFPSETAHGGCEIAPRDLSQTRGPWFDIVTIYAEDPAGPVPATPFPGSRDRLVRSMVLAVLPHFTGPRGIDGRAWTAGDHSTIGRWYSVTHLSFTNEFVETLALHSVHAGDKVKVVEV
jgi:hypothetical protein